MNTPLNTPMNTPLNTPTDSRRKAALSFIFVTVLIDMLAFGMIIPVLPMLVQNFVGGDSARAAQMYGVFGTAWALMQFIASPVQGSLSDRFGRRTVILVSCTGLGLDFILMALAPNIWWLLVGRIISGITAASFSTAGAYIADVTPPERRAASFGLIGAAFGVGFVVGPRRHSRRNLAAPAVLGLRLHGPCQCLLGPVRASRVPAQGQTRAFLMESRESRGALKLLRSHTLLAGLAFSYFFVNLAHGVLPSTAVLYMHYRYGWNARDVGILLAGVGVSSLVVQGFLVKPLVRLLKERRAVAVGLTFGAVGFAIYGLARTGPLFWIGVPVMALWGIATPSLQTMMTQLVSATEQGRLQGALASLMSVANLIGPTLFTQTFAIFIGAGTDWNLPGAPFLLASALIITAMVLAWRATHALDVSVAAQADSSGRSAPLS